MVIKKILIADDSATVRHFLSEALSRQGFGFITANNGDEAILKAKAEMPDLVLMDIMMPGLNGFQATRALANDAATRHIPVVILTGKDMESDRLHGLQEGARDFISKPVDPVTLLAKIRQFESI